MNEDTFVPEKVDQMEMLNYFVCLLCYGVAIDPVKCVGCETIYCKRCLPTDALGVAYDYKIHKKRYTCFKSCGANKTTQLGRIERNILNGFVFNCQHADEGCDAQLTYE